MIAHFTAVAKEAKAPIIMYSVASRTGCNIEPATVAALVKNVDNIVGVKEASGNISQIAKIMSMTDGNIDLYSGNDDQIVPLLSLGGIGVISVLANVAPKETHDICAKFFEGDIEGSAKLQLKAVPLIDRLFCEVNPIPVKKALNLLDRIIIGIEGYMLIEASFVISMSAFSTAIMFRILRSNDSVLNAKLLTEYI